MMENRTDGSVFKADLPFECRSDAVKLPLRAFHATRNWQSPDCVFNLRLYRERPFDSLSPVVRSCARSARTLPSSAISTVYHSAIYQVPLTRFTRTIFPLCDRAV